MLTDIDGLLNDFNRAVSEYLSDLEFDQADFVQVEERLNTINRMKEKYGGTIQEILAYQKERQEEIARLQDADAYRMQLTERMERARKEAEGLCGLSLIHI